MSFLYSLTAYFPRDECVPALLAKAVLSHKEPTTSDNLSPAAFPRLLAFKIKQISVLSNSQNKLLQIAHLQGSHTNNFSLFFLPWSFPSERAASRTLAALNAHNIASGSLGTPAPGTHKQTLAFHLSQLTSLLAALLLCLDDKRKWKREHPHPPKGEITFSTISQPGSSPLMTTGSVQSSSGEQTQDAELLLTLCRGLY